MTIIRMRYSSKEKRNSRVEVWLLLSTIAFAIISFVHHHSQIIILNDQTPLIDSSFHKGISITSSRIPSLEIMQRQLEQLSIRYYVHSDPRISQPNITENLILNRGRGRLKERFRPEALLEHAVLEALEKHPLRTRTAQEAQLFIIPLRVGASVIHRGLHMPKVIAALSEHEHWNYGHGHVIVALNTATFTYEHRSDVARHGFNKEIYDFFANVTVVKSWDDFRCAQLTHNAAIRHDYKGLFAESKYTMSRYGFSLGLLAEPSLPYLEASYTDKFEHASNWIFYRTRVHTSFYNSTPYRHAPLSVSKTSITFNQSCIGFDLNKTEWLQQFVNSKYCLAIRGDTPHTHALIRAVKVGCIPLIVSDYYPLYAPTFSSTIDMSRYSIFIGEGAFMKDPAGALMGALVQSQVETEARLRELRFAQRVLLYDHPKSLFVQAFMKEALMASELPPSKYSFV